MNKEWQKMCKLICENETTIMADVGDTSAPSLGRQLIENAKPGMTIHIKDRYELASFVHDMLLNGSVKVPAGVSIRF